MAVKIPESRLKALREEISMSEKLNKEILQPILTESIRRYIGDFIPEFGKSWDVILNEVYPIIQNNLPSIFFRNPRAFLKPRHKTFIVKRRDPRSGKMIDVQLDATKSARTQEHILNYAISEIKYKREGRKMLLDALLFPHGVLWHGYKGEFGMTEEQSLIIKNDNVFVKRLNPLRFIFDPCVTLADIDEARWVGRIIDIPYQDFIEDKEFDIDKKLIKGFQGFGDKLKVKKEGKETIDVSAKAKSLIDFASEEFKKSDYSKFVRVYEIYLRPTKKEKRDGGKGWILLISLEQDKPLRINEWMIKAEGWPAKLLVLNELNDSMFSLPDIDTYKQIADQKNIITNLQIRNAQETTKVWVGIDKEGADEDQIEIMRKGENTLVFFEGGDRPINQRMFVSSPGGQGSSELYLIDQRIQRNLEDKSGVTDLKRGFLQSGEESAASVKIRNAGGGARPAYRQDLMSDFLKESFLYLNQLLKQFVPYKKAVRIVGSLDIEWSDNISKEELQADTDVELDVISMLPENPERELQQLGQALTLMIDGVRDPAIANKIAQEGKMLNLAPIIEQMLLRLRINNPDIFRNIKPEESQGFVSVAEVRAAKANVESALKGDRNIPSPPEKGQDHRARIEVYSTIFELIKNMGQTIASEILTQLMQIHAAFLQEIAEKEDGVKQVNLPSKPYFNSPRNP